VKICIDPGHGMGAASLGVYDPGAVAAGVEEADVALDYSFALKTALEERGQSVWMTRQSRQDPSLTTMRARRAESQACSMLVSIHLNAFSAPSANGTETLYGNAQSMRLAQAAQDATRSAFGFADRGIKSRPELAALKFRSGPSILLELGFISNAGDRAEMLDPTRRAFFGHAVATALLRGPA